MKKNILVILTAVAIVLTIFSSLLCILPNAKLTSVGIKIDEKLASIDFGEKLLRDPNATSYVTIFADEEMLNAYIEVFDAAESFSFPMRLGMVIWFSLASLIHAIAFPVASILLMVLYFKKKSIFTLKLAHIVAAVGAVLTLLPFSLSLVVMQNIYETARFEFSIVNPYIIVAIEAVFAIVSFIVVSRLALTDKYVPGVCYSQAAYEEGGIMYGTEAPKSKKLLGLKKSAKAPKAENENTEA